MADYFTHFFCALDVGSPEKASAALDLLNRLHLEEEDAPDPAFTSFTLSLQDGLDSTVLWFHDEDGQGDASGVIRFVLRFAEEVDLTGLWGFEVAFSCSRPRLDAFGGAAHVIDLGARTVVGQMSTNEWLTVALSGGDLDAVEALVQ